MIQFPNNNDINERIKKEYEYREIIREIYDKGELLYDLTGKLFDLRNKYVIMMNVDIKSYYISFSVTDNKYADPLFRSIEAELRNFIHKYFYLSTKLNPCTLDEFLHSIDNTHILVQDKYNMYAINTYSVSL